MYKDECNPVSEAAGFHLPFRAYVVEGSVTTDDFEGSALVPFAPSAIQARAAVVSQAIQAAAGRGKTIAANDVTVVGGIS